MADESHPTLTVLCRVRSRQHPFSPVSFCPCSSARVRPFRAPRHPSPTITTRPPPPGILIANGLSTVPLWVSFLPPTLPPPLSTSVRVSSLPLFYLSLYCTVAGLCVLLDSLPLLLPVYFSPNNSF